MGLPLVRFGLLVVGDNKRMGRIPFPSNRKRQQRQQQQGRTAAANNVPSLLWRLTRGETIWAECFEPAVFMMVALSVALHNFFGKKAWRQAPG